MRAKHLYLALCLVGTVLPVTAFLPFLRAHGLDVDEFLAQLFATPVSGFFGWDVIVSSVVLWAFVCVEGRRLTMGGLWAPIAANLVAGVSLGLPLFSTCARSAARRPADPQPQCPHAARA